MTLADSQKALRTPERMADFLRHRYGLVLALDVAQGYVSERPRFWKKVIAELNTDADTAERYWNPPRRNPSKGKVVATSYTKATHLPEAKGE